MINDKNYIHISAFMIKDLKLKGNELLLYAIIYGFSQDGESNFSGSRNYLSEFLNVSKPTIDSALNSLCDKGLIFKITETKNRIVFNYYKINTEILDFTSGKESLLGSKETLPPPSKETLHNNNIYNNNYNNKENNISKDIFKEKQKYGENGKIILTLEQYKNLINDYGKDYVDFMIEKLDEYVAMNNNKNGYKDFNLVLRKAIREKWFKTDNISFNKPNTNMELDLDSKADTINSNMPNLELRAEIYFTNLYNTDRNKYYTELEKLKSKNKALADYVIKQVENCGFEVL